MMKKDVQTIISLISLIIAILSAAFTGWQTFVAHKTYDVYKKQLHLAEKQTQTANDALLVAQNGLKINQKQLDKDFANLEIQRLDSINSKLKNVYFSLLNTNSLQDGIEYSKLKFLEQRVLVKKYGKEKILQRIDSYYRFMSKVYPIIHYLNQDEKSYQILTDVIQHLNLLTMPQNIDNWSLEQYQTFYNSTIINDINTIQAMIAEVINKNKQKSNKLRKDFF